MIPPLLARPRSAPLIAMIAMALALPALGVGLFGDDYLHRSVLLGVGGAGRGTRPVLDLFAFVPQGPRRAAAVDLGLLTWWSHPGLHVALLRPLASLTHVLDYTLWPDAFALQHLHSVLWYGLAVFAVAAFYRKVHGATAVAGLAAVLFAVEDAHAMCVGWLANRHALVALVAGIAALEAHRRWRTGGGAVWAATAISAFALGLLSSEAALAAGGYIVAWQLTMDDAPRRRRLLALLPYGVVVAGWRALYVAAGYGTHGSGLYVDPARHPIDFLEALVERWPLLQLAQWFQFPADILVLLPRAVQIGLTLIAVSACLLVARALRPLLRARREARFWAAGMALALVPLCAAFPMDRLLLFSGVGAFPLLALLAERSGLLPGTGPAPGAPPHRRLAMALLVLHGPLAALLLIGRLAILPAFAAIFMSAHTTAPADQKAPRQTYVFVNGQEFPVVYLAIVRQLEDPARAPRRVALLSSITGDNEVRREDIDTLVIRCRGGFLRSEVDRLMRSLATPFRVGERIEMPDFVAEVRSLTADGRPLEAAFHFRAPLEDDRYRFLAWGAAGVADFTLPAIGAGIELPPAPIAPVLARWVGPRGEPRRR